MIPPNPPISPSDINNWPLMTIYGQDARKQLKEMHEAITELNLWQMIHDNPPREDRGYMWDTNLNDMLQQIGNHPNVIKYGHSGATFAFSMRIMQQISLIGFDQFCKANQPETPETPDE